MLPALPSSRGGTSRDAASSNWLAGCGGRSGSRQIRARRPRQQRRGREGEQSRPPEWSQRLRRPRGARAAAGAMLEQLECGAPAPRGAAAGQFRPRGGEGDTVIGLCGPRRRLGAEGPTDPGPLLCAVRSVCEVVTISRKGLATRMAPSLTLLLQPRPFFPCALALSSFF